MGKTNFDEIMKEFTAHDLAILLADWKDGKACEYCTDGKDVICDRKCEQNIYAWLLRAPESDNVPDKV